MLDSHQRWVNRRKICFLRMVLMKKMSLLVFALVVVLPGCCGKKKEAAQSDRRNDRRCIKTNVEDGNVYQLPSGDDEDSENDDEDEKIEDIDLNDDDFGDDEFDLFVKENSMLDEDDVADAAEATEEEAFNWIDAQTDDEFKKLYFSFNHYGIRADQKEAIEYDIEQVRQLVAEAGSSQPTVVVEGHTDQEGSPVYNIGLSEKRATSVADLFVAAGIDRSLIKVIGRGQECPVVINGKVVNGSRDDRAPNRRVEVRVIYT